jgi:hypothetical protein
MKVFVSWSGERSQALATALHQWLPLVLHYVEPWLSKADIDAGDRWGAELGKELTESNFGISCVTKDNVLAPWLLFEAGAIAKSVDAGKLIPLLLDIDFKDLSGPLTQFQAKKAEQQGILELVESVNNSATNPVPDARLKQLFGALWPELENKIEAIPASSMLVKVARPEGEILEELVASVRTVDSRVRDVLEEDGFSRKRRSAKFYPPMMRELTHEISTSEDDPIQIIVFASFFRDDVPWLYELGLLAYRAIVSKDVAGSRRTLRSFQRGLKMVTHGPFGREFGVDRERMHMLLMESEYIFEGDLVNRFGVKGSSTRRKPDQVEIEPGR